ncbi:MAG: hypothetical protein QOC96_1558 [Acidobacteriota bacterium]|jgi:hypothetical protein|nr:hypothetical protein [Acidobacteriota bacterium]
MNKFRHGSWLTQATVLLALLLFAVPFASAQSTTGNLQGIVKDPNGAVVAGAAVKVTNNDTGQSKETTTNGEGFYRVTNLTPGDNYTVEVTAQGYAPKTEKVGVRLGLENNADISLALGTVTGVVEVTSDTNLIQSTQSQLSQTYTPKQLTELPYNGGSIDNLALLTPGVATPGDADFTNGVGISANGNRGRSNNFQIDGQDNNDNSVAGPSLTLTNTEAIGEYQIITNSFSAEFGRNAGAQINVITKPGTNEFHGTAFEYLQNSALNARNNLEKQNAATFRFLGNIPGSLGTSFTNLANNRQGKDPYTYNRFGGAIGGPIKKNKAFFFVTYQGDRQRGTFTSNNFGADTLIFTPDAVAAIVRSGNFPIGATILNNSAVGGYPTTVTGHGQLVIVPPTIDTNGDGIPDTFAYGAGNPFGNPVTANLLAPVAFIRSGGPTSPIIPLYGGEGIRFTGNNSTEDQLITREDINLTSKDVLSLRYIYDRTFFPDTPATGTTLTGAFFDVPSKNNNLGVTYTRTLSPRFVNEARFNFSRLDVKFGDPAAAQPGTGNPGPGISFSGTRTINFDLFRSFGTANNLPQSRTVDVYQEQDTLSSTIGNHALKFGGDIRQQKVDNFFLPNFLGVYTFNGGNPFLGFTPGGATSVIAGPVPANTFFFDTVGGPGSDRGIAGTCSGVNPCRATAVENLLLGRFRQVNFARGNPNFKTTQNDFFFFVQDDWRIRPSLTLNLGLRYELSTTPFNPIIDQINAREANSNTAIFDTAFPLSTRTATKLPLDKNNFAPRVGFAWQPKMKWLGGFFENKQTVIRGGFGIAYDPSFFNIVLNTVTAAPYAVAGILRQNPGATGSQVFPFLPSTTAQVDLTPGTNGGDPRLFNQTRVDPNFYNPYTMQFNFGIEQELWKNTVFEARYVGSRIVGQFQTVNGNPNVQFLNRAAQCLGLAPGAFSNGIVVGTPAGTNAAACGGSGFSNTGGLTNGEGRIDPTFGATRTRMNGASATYNGLQLRFDTRFRNDLVLNANYTFSKTLDNASEIFSTGGGGQGVADPQRFFNSTSGERGLSAFHQKHIFSMNAIYDLPWYKGQRGVIGHLLGGYRLSGIFRAGSGRPYQPLEAFGTYDPSFENAFFGVGALRPFNGNASAPNGTIAFGFQAVCGVLFGGPTCNDPNAVPGNFVVFNTLQSGSQGTWGTSAQALQRARVIYNDFGLANQFGVSLASLEAFQLFKTPFGDVGRNTFSGLPFYQVNMALYKTTKLTERTQLEFRVEANNLLNRRNFGVPDAFTEDAYTGLAVGSYQNPGFNSGSNRVLRFGLRLLF